MALPTDLNPHFLASSASYQIERSLRFNSADSAYLNRTPASAGNRTTWTWSGWVKITAKTTDQYLFTAGSAGAGGALTGITYSGSQFYLYWNNSSTGSTLTPLYRDPSAWYHLCLVANETAGFLTLYVNGIFVGQKNISGNGAVNDTGEHAIGTTINYGYGYINPIDGYLTEINFIDGSALTPSSFGQTNASTGVWEPIKYTGTYGTNGYFLKFADDSGTTSTTLGKDSSGNGNNWTPNNFSVTAGAGNDSLIDTPTPYADGGNGRGNYCTLNPLDNPNTTYAGAQNGSLEANLGTGVGTFLAGTVSTLGGKYYWEFTPTNVGNGLALGITYGATTTTDANSKAIFYTFNGNKRILGGADTAYGSSYAANDVIGVAVNSIAGTIEFFKNNTSQGVITDSSISLQPFRPFVFNNSSSANSHTICNFGQRPFSYTPPSGFKAMNTQNLPEPTIGATATTRADDYFNTVLYTGTGSSQGITGVGFQPDWVWIKGRSGATDHGLYDAVRGVQLQLESNTTTAETTESTGLTAFGTDGFTVGALAQLNTSSATYVAWNWNAGGSNATNTSGTITSTVRASTTAGFSIVTFTGNGSTSSSVTVGHGLGKVPAFIITKPRVAGGTDRWSCWHKDLGGNYGIWLDLTSGRNPSMWAGYTNISSTVFSPPDLTYGNVNAVTYVAYCFAEIAGYSAFGSYTGNGNADGPFVFVNHRPAFLLIKRTDTTSNWTILDFQREGYNVDNDPLYPNLSDAEGTADLADLLSNGFKLRSTDASVNASAGTYVYAAFAEFPFKYALAR